MSDDKPSTGTDRIFGHIDPDAMKVVRRLLNAGHEAYLVGGCVRDLYLGLAPKDFDVATSATPEAIRKLFRNSRVIGRRFKLAHVFFGPKIIETSTFRTAPEQDDDDPLITHDNEWGSVEDDARRRDFTINGLFYDVDARDIVDFVDGMADLDRRVVRTIGDPELRFREDPVRMIRAIKFAARLGFRIEDATWEALLEVAPDIVRSSRARLLEEIYKLLRSGASRRCFEMLLKTGLLHRIMPEYTGQFGKAGDGVPALLAGLEPPEDDDDDDDDQRPAALLWRYFDALDDYIRQTREDVVNGVLQAVLFAPLVQHEMHDGSRQNLDRAIERAMTPVGTSFGVARRDRELARQIVMSHRRITDQPRRRRRRNSPAQQQTFHDALIFMGISVQAMGGDDSELARWQALAAAQQATPAAPRDRGGGEGRKRSRRRRGGRRNKKPSGSGREAAPSHEG